MLAAGPSRADGRAATPAVPAGTLPPSPAAPTGRPRWKLHNNGPSGPARLTIAQFWGPGSTPLSCPSSTPSWSNGCVGGCGVYAGELTEGLFGSVRGHIVAASCPRPFRHQLTNCTVQVLSLAAFRHAARASHGDAGRRARGGQRRWRPGPPSVHPAPASAAADTHKAIPTASRAAMCCRHSRTGWRLAAGPQAAQRRPWPQGRRRRR